MTVLDATKLESENDIAEEIEAGDQSQPTEQETSGEPGDDKETPPSATLHSPGPLRTFTLDLPTDCQTTIKIIAQQGADAAWRVVYEIARQYETSPYEKNNIDEAVINAELEGVNHLGYAILPAVDEAAFWISTHSEDDDEKAKAALAYLESWYDELDVESVTEAIFDPLPEPVAEVASETPAAYECETAKPAAVTATVSTVDSLNKAVADFEEQKQFLQNRLCVLLGEEESISEELKEIRQSRKRVAKQYHEHLARGPERLPLIDNAPQPAINQEAVEKSAKAIEKAFNETAEMVAGAADVTPELAAAAVPVAEPVEADDESWRAVLIEATSIPIPICKILNGDNCIYNLGQLVDFQTIDPNDQTKSRPLTDLHRIGQAKADKIEEALIEYWAANPRK
jgi:hypothetical protein